MHSLLANKYARRLLREKETPLQREQHKIANREAKRHKRSVARFGMAYLRIADLERIVFPNTIYKDHIPYLLE